LLVLAVFGTKCMLGCSDGSLVCVDVGMGPRTGVRMGPRTGVWMGTYTQNTATYEHSENK